MTSYATIGGITSDTAQPLVIRRYVDYQRTCSAACR
jgi:hypothetical protein